MSEAIEGELLETPDELDPDAVLLGAPSRVGRPTDMTPHVVAKLIAALSYGFNISEACQYAEIARTTYYRWMEGDDAFSNKMSIAQTAPNRKAKKILMDAIDQGDAALALRFLMLRDPDFKPKASIDPGPEAENTRQKIRGFLDDTDDGSYDEGGTESAASDEPTSVS